MSYFEQGMIDFFEELADNNKKEWFHANKKRYENFVKDPFRDFVTELIVRIQEEDPDFATTTKDAIFRINRDIRFSKDKTPYKTHVGASMKNGKRTAVNLPGYYVHLAANKVSIGGGLYHVDKNGIYKVREYISDNLTEFNKVVKQSEKIFGKIGGDQIKRIPKEFKEAHEKQPLIANKSFYNGIELDPSEMLTTDFLGLVMNYISKLRPLNDFFNKALK